MDSHEQTPATRVQYIAVGTYNVADRFPAYDEAFGHRLKNTAAALIESVALYDVAKTRDALGTNRLLHQILGHIEALRALLNFAKNRGVSPATTVDIVLWNLEQLSGHFAEVDSRLERHAGIHHPQGALVFGQLDIPAQTQPVDVARTKFDTFGSPSQEGGAYTLQQPVINSAAARFEPIFNQEQEPASNPVLAQAAPVIAAASFASFPVGNNRQKRILDFFSLRRRAQLKDVLLLFPGISEKTVRNDLALLCKVGNLRRVGLAPRSHYMLMA